MKVKADINKGAKTPVLPLPSPGKTKTQKSGTASVSSPAKASSAGVQPAQDLSQWAKNVLDFGTKMEEDFSARKNTYQTPESFSAYQKEQNNTISALTKNGSDILKDLEQNKDRYTPEEYDERRNGVIELSRYLNGVVLGLERERKYYAQFASPVEWSDYTEKVLKQPIDVIGRQMQVANSAKNNAQNPAIGGKTTLAPPKTDQPMDVIGRQMQVTSSAKDNATNPAIGGKTTLAPFDIAKALSVTEKNNPTPADAAKAAYLLDSLGLKKTVFGRYYTPDDTGEKLIDLFLQNGQAKNKAEALKKAKRLLEIGDTAQFSIANYLEQGVGNLVNQAGYMAGSLVDFLEQNTIGEVVKFLVDVHGGDGDKAKKSTPVHQMYEDIQNNQVYFDSQAAKNINNIKSEQGRAVAQRVYGFLGSLGPAAVMAIEAVMTGGLSLVENVAGAASSAALEAYAYLQNAPSVVNTLSNALWTMVSNPNYWGAFTMTFGPDYEEAKANGANEFQAITHAVTNGLISAAIEIGGGIQSLPEKVKAWDIKGYEILQKVWDIVKSAIEEGMEEVEQGWVVKTLQNIIYGKGNPIFSTTDSNAIFNPNTAKDEFEGGVAVSAILGPVQAALVKFAQSGQYVAAGQEITAATTPEQREAITQKMIADALKTPEGSTAHEYAAKAEMQFAETGTLDSKTLGRLYWEYKNAVEKFGMDDISQNTEKVSEYTKTLGTAGQKIFNSMYNDWLDPDNYISDMMRAYNAGKDGGTLRETLDAFEKSGHYDGTDNTRIMAAFLAGQTDATETNNASKKVLPLPAPGLANIDSETESKGVLPLPAPGINAQNIRNASQMGREGYNAFQRTYDEGAMEKVGMSEAFDAFSRVYNAVVNGQDVNAVIKEVSNIIPENMILEAQKAAEADAGHTAQTTYLWGKAKLVRDKFLRRANLRSAEIHMLDAIAKVAGVRIRFVETISNGDDNAQYNYDTGEFEIALDSIDPVRTVLTHELVHRIRDAAPEAFKALANFVLDNISEGRVLDAFSQRAKAYKTTDTYILSEEVIADALGYMLTNSNVLNEFVQENRTAGQKLLDAVHDFIAEIKDVLAHREAMRLTDNQLGAYSELLDKTEEMASLFKSALDQVQERGETAQTAEKNVATKGDVKCSIKLIDGKYMPVVDVKNDTRSFSVAKNYLEGLISAEDPFEIINSDAQPVYIGKDFPGEYIHSQYTQGMRSALRNVKMQAVTDLKDMVLLAKNGEWQENLEDKHKVDAANGWYRYDTEFAVPIRNVKGEVTHYTIYTAVLLIRNDADGKSYLYDMLDLDEKKKVNNSVPSTAKQSEIFESLPSSNAIIPQTSEKSNTKKSRKLDADYPSAVERNDMETAQQIEAALNASNIYRKSKDNNKNNLRSDDVLEELTKTAPEETEDRAAVERLRQKDLDDFWEDTVRLAQMIAEEETPDPENLVLTGVERAGKPFKEKVEDVRSFIARKIFDAGDAVRQIQKQTKDRYLYSYFNQARASANSAVEMIEGNRFDIFGRKTGDGLNKVLENVRSKGEEYYKQFQLYLLHLHNVDRMQRESQSRIDEARASFETFKTENPQLSQFADYQISRMAADETSPYYFEAGEYMRLLDAMRKAERTTNLPVFGHHVTAQDSQAAADRLLRENPEFQEEAEKVYAYIDNLLRYRVDSGLISEQDYEMLKKIYPHYVPTYRVFDKEAGPETRDADSVRIGKTIETAKGGSENIMPLHMALAQQTMNVVREGSKNRFGQRMMNDGSRKTKYIRSVEEYSSDFNEDTFDALDDPALKKTNTFIVRENGRMYQMTLTPELFEAVKALSPDRPENNFFLNSARKINRAFKSLVTSKNPTFLIKNGARDIQDAALYSKGLRKFAKQYPQAWKEIVTNGEYWQRYKALGGIYSSFFENGREADTEAGSVRNTAQKIKEKTVGRIETLNEWVEQAPRFAEFMATMKKNGGLNADMDACMEALHNAAEITVNFGRGGTWSKFINEYLVPFWNPAIQGFSKMVRTATETKGLVPWGKLIAKSVLFGIAPFALNALLFGDDEEWEVIDDRTKNTYYLFKLQNGTWLKIPKGRVLSVIGAGSKLAWDAANGEDIDLSDFIEFTASQTAPSDPLNNNIFAAWSKTKLFDPDDPGETWYGSDIESQRLRGYAPGERYDQRTDTISRWIGKQLGVSPKKLNYLFDQYSGVIGDVLLPVFTPASDRGALSGALGMWEKAFTLNPTVSNKLSGEFYDQLDELEYAKNADGASGSDAVIYRFWNKQSSTVSEINKSIREIEADTSLDNAEKRERLQVQHGLRNVAIRQAQENLPKYQEAANKYYQEAGEMAEDDRQEYAYRMANRDVLGAEEALRIYHKDVYEKAQKLSGEGVSFDHSFDVYFGMKEVSQGLKGYQKSNVERDVIREAKLNEKEKIALYQTFTDTGHDRDDDIERCSKAGLSFDQFMEAQNQYAEINAKYDKEKANRKTIELSRWINSQGFTEKQAAALRESFSFFNMNPQDETKYDKLLASGVDEEKAYDLALKYEELQKILPEYDADGNGSYKHAEIRAALNAMDITPEERAELWALRTGKTKSSFYDLPAPGKKTTKKMTSSELALPAPGKLPSLDLNLPKVKLPSLDLNLPKVKLPSLDLNLPKAKLPVLDLPAPGLKR